MPTTPNSNKAKLKLKASMNMMDLNEDVPRSPSLHRGKTHSYGARMSLSTEFTTSSTKPPTLSPMQRRNSVGSPLQMGHKSTSVAERKKSRYSYLNKRKGREGDKERKDLIRSSLFSEVDTVFGEEDEQETSTATEGENSYLKRLLLSPSGSNGNKSKKMNVDNCRLQKKKRPVIQKKRMDIKSSTSTSNSTTSIASNSKPVPVPVPVVTPIKEEEEEQETLQTNNISSSITKVKLKESAEQKRLSADSIDTAPTEGSDSTDNDNLTAVTNSTASLVLQPELDYSDLLVAFERTLVEVKFDGPQYDQRPFKIRFQEKAQQASIADLINCSADAQSEFVWEDLFYTEEELSDQRHEAFLEMCGLDDDDDAF